MRKIGGKQVINAYGPKVEKKISKIFLSANVD